MAGRVWKTLLFLVPPSICAQEEGRFQQSAGIFNVWGMNSFLVFSFLLLFFILHFFLSSPPPPLPPTSALFFFGFLAFWLFGFLGFFLLLCQRLMLTALTWRPPPAQSRDGPLWHFIRHLVDLWATPMAPVQRVRMNRPNLPLIETLRVNLLLVKLSINWHVTAPSTH